VARRQAVDISQYTDQDQNNSAGNGNRGHNNLPSG
jgi:hypothetical protein